MVRIDPGAVTGAAADVIGALQGSEGWSLDPQAWRDFDTLAQELGWETGIDLVADMMTHPEDYESPGDPVLQRMSDAMKEWDPLIKDIGGYGALIFSGGINNIFIKSLMGRPEDIDKGDVLTAAMELIGSYGIGNAGNLLKRLPGVGPKLTPILDDLLTSIGRFGVTDDAGNLVDDALKAAQKGMAEEGARKGPSLLKVTSVDEAEGVLDYLINYTLREGGTTREAALKFLTSDEISKMAKFLGQSTDDFVKGESKVFSSIIDDLAKAGAKAGGEAGEAGAKLGADLIDEIIIATKDDIPRESIEAAAGYMKGKWSDAFIKKFVSEATAKAKNLPVDQAIDEGFQLATKATPSAGLTPGFIKNLSLTRPTLKKLLTLSVAGGGLGTGYLGIKGLQEAAFGGFLVEEAEQMAMFAQFFSSDDMQLLARTISTVTLPVWDTGETWAKSIGRPLVSLTGMVVGEERSASMLSGPALNYHDNFTKAMIDKISILQERGAWTGLVADITTGEITDWGRPTTANEVKSFLSNNPEYFSFYDAEMQKLARENPALLYQLYYEGYADWYTDLPGWMREQIDAYKQQLKDWEYAANRGELTGQDAMDMADALMSTIWYDQKDKAILQDAINAGNLVYTMMQSGEIAEAKGTALLNSLAAKLKNNNHTKGLLNLDTTGRVQWKALSESEMAQKYGSLTTIADKPQIVFQPPGTELTMSVTTPYFSGAEKAPADIVNLGREVSKDLGIDLGKEPVTLRGEEAEKVKRMIEQFAESARGVEGMRGVGAVGGPTPSEKEAMAKVPSAPGLDIEGLSNTESRWVTALAEGSADWETLKRINPEVYKSLQDKGYKPGEKPVLPEEAPAEEPTTPSATTTEKPPSVPKGGAFGYERTERREKAISPDEAYLMTAEAALRQPQMSEKDLMEIYEFLTTSGKDYIKAIGKDWESEEAKKSVFESLGVVEHAPKEEGWGKTYGVGRIQR
jgi:hypothetical protein